MYRRVVYPLTVITVAALLVVFWLFSRQSAPTDEKGISYLEGNSLQAHADMVNLQKEPNNRESNDGQSLSTQKNAQSGEFVDALSGKVNSAQNVTGQNQLPYKHDPLMDQLVDEINEHIERGGLSLGNLDYSRGKILATKERAEAYSALVKSAGSRNIIDEFKVTSSEVREKAATIEMTAVVSQVSREHQNNGQNSAGHGNSIVIRPDTINIKDGLDNETLSMVTYDQALLGALDSVIDEKIVGSFFTKNRLTPREDAIQFIENWGQKGLMLTVLLNGEEYSRELFRGLGKDTDQSDKSEVLSETRRSVQFEVAMKNFRNRIDQVVSPSEKELYFSDPTKFNRFNLLAFVKSKVKIHKEMPSAMRELVSHRFP